MLDIVFFRGSWKIVKLAEKLGLHKIYAKSSILIALHFFAIS